MFMSHYDAVGGGTREGRAILCILHLKTNEIGENERYFFVSDRAETHRVCAPVFMECSRRVREQIGCVVEA